MFFSFLAVSFVYASTLAPLPTIDEDSLECMTKALYHEAAVEPYEGKLEVAAVILNRVKYDQRVFPTTVCGVIHQKSRNPKKPYLCQFSFTCNPVTPIAYSSRAYRESYTAAFTSLVIQASTTDAMYYVNCKVKRAWLNSLTFKKRIGNHCFYS